MGLGSDFSTMGLPLNVKHWAGFLISLSLNVLICEMVNTGTSLMVLFEESQIKRRLTQCQVYIKGLIYFSCIYY